MQWVYMQWVYMQWVYMQWVYMAKIPSLSHIVYSHTLTIVGNAGGDYSDGRPCHAHSVLEEAEGCWKHSGT